MKSFREARHADTPAAPAASRQDFVERVEAVTATPFKKQVAAETADEDFEVPEVEAEELAEVESEEPSAEDEFAWLEAVKPYKQLHGLELADVLKSLSDGYIPDSLMDALKIKGKRFGEEYERPLSKARSEFMMHEDYTQKTQAFNKERDEFNTDKDEFIGMLQNWKGDAKSLYSGLVNLDFPVLEMAKLVAARERELGAMTPKERELYDAKTKTERELENMRREQKQLEQKKTKAEIEAAGRAQTDFVSEASTKMFAALKLPLNKNTYQSFLNKFKIIAESLPPGTKWTEDMVQLAVEATNEDYKSVLGRREQQQAAANPPAAQQFESPAREQVAKLKSEARPPVKRKGQTGAMRGSDFMKQILGKRI